MINSTYWKYCKCRTNLQASLLPKHSPNWILVRFRCSAVRRNCIYIFVVTCYCDHCQCHHLYQYQYHYNHKITATVVFVMCTHVNIRMYLSMCQGNSANTLSQNHILNPEKKYSKTQRQTCIVTPGPHPEPPRWTFAWHPSPPSCASYEAAKSAPQSSGNGANAGTFQKYKQDGASKPCHESSIEW